MTRSLLMLSYLFPPRGGPGVQRVLKFVKYLPQFGWHPMVIASGESHQDNIIKVQDPTLLRELPGECLVRYTPPRAPQGNRLLRAHAALRERLAPTDPMGWWVEPAVQTALHLLREHAAQAIFVSMSPFTAAEAGIRLKQLTKLPLVLDLRDPWALDETRIYPTRWHARADWAAMARALAAADLVIMNTSKAADAARAAFVVPSSTRLIALPNGFDAEDFLAAEHQPTHAPRDRLRIVHVGIFHTDLAPLWDDLVARRSWRSRLKYARRPINLWTRTPRYLLAAMTRLVEQARIPADKLELVLVGQLSKGDEALIANTPLRPSVRSLGYQNHLASVRWLQSADVLFLPVHMPLDGGPALVAPGKTYEYLGSGRPILAMGPPGDVRQIVQEMRAGFAIAGDDVTAAADALERIYQAKLIGRHLFDPDCAGIARFERRELARSLAEQMHALVDRSSSLLSSHRSPMPL